MIPSKDDKDPQATLRRILKETTLDYVDCFLVHTPSAGAETRERIWKALEAIHAEGLAKSIGVSNYGVGHLREMERYGTVPPCLNQVELHPFMQQPAIVKVRVLARRRVGLRSIARAVLPGERYSDRGVRAATHTEPTKEVCEPTHRYCPIARGAYLDNPDFKRIAQAHDVSVAQVLLRWSLQKGCVGPLSLILGRTDRRAQLHPATQERHAVAHQGQRRLVRLRAVGRRDA